MQTKYPIYRLEDVRPGVPVKLWWFKNSTSHSFNEGKMVFTPKTVDEGVINVEAWNEMAAMGSSIGGGGVTPQPITPSDAKLMATVKGDGGNIYTSPHTAKADGYPDDTLYRGSGCEPLFVVED